MAFSNIKFYKLTRDLANPEHDKRCKRGWRGAQVVKAGTLFRSYSDPIDDIPITRYDVKLAVWDQLTPCGRTLFAPHLEELKQER